MIQTNNCQKRSGLILARIVAQKLPSLKKLLPHGTPEVGFIVPDTASKKKGATYLTLEYRLAKQR
jgi:hypothetical protein